MALSVDSRHVKLISGLTILGLAVLFMLVLKSSLFESNLKQSFGGLG